VRLPSHDAFDVDGVPRTLLTPFFLFAKCVLWRTADKAQTMNGIPQSAMETIDAFADMTGRALLGNIESSRQ
jgi:hypothetical protein